MLLFAHLATALASLALTSSALPHPQGQARPEKINLSLENADPESYSSTSSSSSSSSSVLFPRSSNANDVIIIPNTMTMSCTPCRAGLMMVCTYCDGDDDNTEKQQSGQELHSGPGPGPGPGSGSARRCERIATPCTRVMRDFADMLRDGDDGGSTSFLG